MNCIKRLSLTLTLALLSGGAPLTVGPSPALAGGGPESLVLVVNQDSPASLSIANEYIALRKIPSLNVIYLSDIPPKQVWDLENFQTKILRPILETIENRGITHIDYIVYSAGFPTTIRIQPHAKAFYDKFSVPKRNRRAFGKKASINALTYFARSVLADRPGYMLLNSNFYMRMPADQILKRPFVGALQRKFVSAVEQYHADEFDTAIRAWTKMAQNHPHQVAVQYWLARAHARNGDFNSARLHLVEAIRGGWCYRDFTQNDNAFSGWKKSRSFKSLVEKIADLPFKYAPTTGFQASTVWGANGMVNGDPSQGQRYFLSTVLAVARNRGTTEAEAIQQLRTAVAADHTYPEGSFIYTDTGGPRTKPRKPFFEDAISELRKMGFEASVVKGRLPSNRADIVGMSFGTSRYDLEKAQLKFRPGAIVENFTSYGGALQKGAGQTPLSECLRHGAAGSSGTVSEPYAILNKFPHPMMHVHYARGASLAEAFYQSVQGPYMLLIVGDPLCQPWARPPKLEVSGLPAEGDPVSGKLTIRPRVTGEVSAGKIEIFLDGRPHGNAGIGEPISFNTDSITDGYHELRLVAAASNPVRAETSWARQLWVENQATQIDLEVDGGVQKSIDDRLTLRATSSLAGEIGVFQNTRRVAVIDPETGSVEIDAKSLGRGATRLQAAIRRQGGGDDADWIFSRPVALEISY